METDPQPQPPSHPVADAILMADPMVTASPDAVGTVDVSERFHQLDPRSIRVEQISGLIFSTIFFAGTLLGSLILWFGVGFQLLWFCLVGGGLLLSVALFVSSWFWPPVTHRHRFWRLDEEGLEIRRGVFWRHQITIPLGRVQHADVSQGPLQRPFEIGTLTVNTAGTQNASIELEGLAHATAIALRDEIVGQRKGQNVV